MKAIYKILLFLLTMVILSSCEKSYSFEIMVPKKTILNEKIKISIQEENNRNYEKVLFFVNGKEVPAKDGEFILETKDYGVGKQVISAMVYYVDGRSKRINNSLEIFSNIPYQAYNYKIINTYPHDPKAFTQGLEYRNGFLYESTGHYGESTIRKVDITTGNVIQKTDIDKKYFGEGITFLNEKLHHLTWKARKGFIYNPETMEQEGEFAYGKSKEGWGLTNNGSELIKSDGTNKIWFLDAITQREVKSIQAYTNKRRIGELNEMEYIDGKIYANYWQKPLIAIINPENGIVEGIINLSGLVKEVKKSQNLNDQDDVLNGIAYDAENDRLFVTGKNWNKLFEIQLVKQ